MAFEDIQKVIEDKAMAFYKGVLGFLGFTSAAPNANANVEPDPIEDQLSAFFHISKDQLHENATFNPTLITRLLLGIDKNKGVDQFHIAQLKVMPNMATNIRDIARSPSFIINSFLNAAVRFGANVASFIEIKNLRGGVLKSKKELLFRLPYLFLDSMQLLLAGVVLAILHPFSFANIMGLAWHNSSIFITGSPLKFLIMIPELLRDERIGDLIHYHGPSLQRMVNSIAEKYIDPIVKELEQPQYIYNSREKAILQLAKNVLKGLPRLGQFLQREENLNYLIGLVNKIKFNDIPSTFASWLVGQKLNITDITIFIKKAIEGSCDHLENIYSKPNEKISFLRNNEDTKKKLANDIAINIESILNDLKKAKHKESIKNNITLLLSYISAQDKKVFFNENQDMLINMMKSTISLGGMRPLLVNLCQIRAVKPLLIRYLNREHDSKKEVNQGELPAESYLKNYFPPKEKLSQTVGHVVDLLARFMNELSDKTIDAAFSLAIPLLTKIKLKEEKKQEIKDEVTTEESTFIDKGPLPEAPAIPMNLDNLKRYITLAIELIRQGSFNRQNLKLLLGTIDQYEVSHFLNMVTKALKIPAQTIEQTIYLLLGSETENKEPPKAEENSRIARLMIVIGFLKELSNHSEILPSTVFDAFQNAVKENQKIDDLLKINITNNDDNNREPKKKIYDELTLIVLKALPNFKEEAEHTEKLKSFLVSFSTENNNVLSLAMNMILPDSEELKLVMNSGIQLVNNVMGKISKDDESMNLISEIIVEKAQCGSASTQKYINLLSNLGKNNLINKENANLLFDVVKSLDIYILYQALMVNPQTEKKLALALKFFQTLSKEKGVTKAPLYRAITRIVSHEKKIMEESLLEDLSYIFAQIVPTTEGAFNMDGLKNCFEKFLENESNYCDLQSLIVAEPLKIEGPYEGNGKEEVSEDFVIIEEEEVGNKENNVKEEKSTSNLQNFKIVYDKLNLSFVNDPAKQKFTVHIKELAPIAYMVFLKLLPKYKDVLQSAKITDQDIAFLLDIIATPTAMLELIKLAELYNERTNNGAVKLSPKELHELSLAALSVIKEHKPQEKMPVDFLPKIGKLSIYFAQGLIKENHNANSMDLYKLSDEIKSLDQVETILNLTLLTKIKFKDISRSGSLIFKGALSYLFPKGNMDERYLRYFIEVVNGLTEPINISAILGRETGLMSEALISGKIIGDMDLRQVNLDIKLLFVNCAFKGEINLGEIELATTKLRFINCRLYNGATLKIKSFADKSVDKKAINSVFGENISPIIIEECLNQTSSQINNSKALPVMTLGGVVTSKIKDIYNGLPTRDTPLNLYKSISSQAMDIVDLFSGLGLWISGGGHSF